MQILPKCACFREEGGARPLTCLQGGCSFILCHEGFQILIHTFGRSEGETIVKYTVNDVISVGGTATAHIKSNTKGHYKAVGLAQGWNRTVTP